MEGCFIGAKICTVDSAWGHLALKLGACRACGTLGLGVQGDRVLRYLRVEILYSKVV